MHLRRIGPMHTANLRIESCKQLAGRIREIDRDEETPGHWENVERPTSNVQLPIVEGVIYVTRCSHGAVSPRSDELINASTQRGGYNDLAFASLFRAVALSAERVNHSGTRRRTSEPLRNWFPSPPLGVGKNRFTSRMA